MWQRLRTSAGITRVRTFDVEVVVTPDGGTAEASGVVEITRSIAAAPPERDLHEVRADVRPPPAGEWLLSRAAVVDAVEPPR